MRQNDSWKMDKAIKNARKEKSTARKNRQAARKAKGIL